jgi:hypothetical protein
MNKLQILIFIAKIAEAEWKWCSKTILSTINFDSSIRYYLVKFKIKLRLFRFINETTQTEDFN